LGLYLKCGQKNNYFQQEVDMKKFIYVLILLVFQMALGGPTKLSLTGQVKAIAFSPDSNYLACATDEEVFVYRSSDWRLIQNFKIGKEIRALTFSPTKRLLAIARGSNVIVYDYNSWTLVALLSSPVDVYCVQFSPRGDVLLFGTHWTDANIHVYDTSSWKEITAFGASMTKNSICFDRWQRYVAFTSNYKYYPKIYSTRSWNHVATLKGGYGEYDHNTFWYSIKFSPNGRFVAYGFVDIPAKKRTIFVHQAIGQWPLTFSISWGGDSSLWGVRISSDGHSVSGLGSLDFSPDGQLLAHGAEDVRLFRVDPLLGTLTLVNILKVSQPMGEHSLQFSPNGQYLAYADGKDVCVWRVADIPQKLCFGDVCLDAPQLVVIAVGIGTAALMLIQNLITAK
jgi:WD40 repeat protein